jgi:hypothetical protein
MDAGTFEPHTGSEFRVAGSERSEGSEQNLPSIRLEVVTGRPAQVGGPRSDPFTLEFTGPQPVLEQRTYTLDHRALGLIELFLVPIGIDPDGRVRYEAVFN